MLSRSPLINILELARSEAVKVDKNLESDLKPVPTPLLSMRYSIHAILMTAKANNILDWGLSARKDMMINCYTKTYNLGVSSKAEQGIHQILMTRHQRVERKELLDQKWFEPCPVTWDDQNLRSSRLRDQHEAKITSDTTLWIEKHSFNALFHASVSSLAHLTAGVLGLWNFRKRSCIQQLEWPASTPWFTHL